MQSNQALLKIDLDALLANFRLLNVRLARGARAGAAVKADAYGLGVHEVAPFLAKNGCTDFFVATLEEGIGLRGILIKNNIQPQIYILNGYEAAAQKLYKEYSLTPVLNSLPMVREFQADNAHQPCALHFDTGMNRLGLGRDETSQLLTHPDDLKNLLVKMIMSHFACADEKDHPLTSAQYESFKKIAGHFPQAEKSLSNSSGIFRDAKYHFDLARPGMALYGLNPTPETSNPMQDVVCLKAPILQIRHARRGESIGYGAGHVLAADTMIGIVGLGYADGFPRILSGKGRLYWQKYACPILGRVSMDLTIIDLSAISESRMPRPGDRVEVLGPHQSADALAQDAGTIGYEILTNLGPRYRRVYHGR